jgi:hypothetical protein
MLLVTLALKTLLYISQNRMYLIKFNKQVGNHLNKDIINAPFSLSSFPFSGCSQVTTNFWPSLMFAKKVGAYTREGRFFTAKWTT